MLSIFRFFASRERIFMIYDDVSSTRTHFPGACLSENRLKPGSPKKSKIIRWLDVSREIRWTSWRWLAGTILRFGLQNIKILLIAIKLGIDCPKGLLCRELKNLCSLGVVRSFVRLWWRYQSNLDIFQVFVDTIEERVRRCDPPITFGSGIWPVHE